MSFGHYLTFLPLLVRDLGVPQAEVAATVGLLATTALIAGLPLVPFWGAWADRYSRKIDHRPKRRGRGAPVRAARVRDAMSGSCSCWCPWSAWSWAIRE